MWCWFHRASGTEHRGEVWQTGAAQFHQKKTPKQTKKLGSVWHLLGFWYDLCCLDIIAGASRFLYSPLARADLFSVSQTHTFAAQQEISQRRRFSSASRPEPCKLKAENEHLLIDWDDIVLLHCWNSYRFSAGRAPDWYQHTKVFIPAVTNFVLTAINGLESIMKHMIAVETAIGRHQCTERGIPDLCPGSTGRNGST